MGDGTEHDVSVPLGLRPFAGLRFAGPPDVVRARTMSPPESWGDPGSPVPADDRHVARLLEASFGGGGARPRLDVWEDDATVVRDLPSVYVYRRTGPDGSTRGLVGAMDLSGRTSAPLVPHEDVRPELVSVQEEFAARTRAQVDPVVAIAARAGGEGRSPLATLLDSLTAGPPAIVVEDGDDVHELWAHDSPAVHLRVARVPVGRVLVADGHHRRRAWSRVDGSAGGWGLTWVVDDEVEPLHLRAVHRVCPGLDLETVERSPLVEVTEVSEDRALAILRSASGPRCVAYSRGRWLDLTPAPGSVPPSCALPDHAICWIHQLWLPDWGVDGDRLDYVHGAATAVRRADAAGAVALLLPATALADVRRAAFAGTTLPAKATSFVPKPRMGLVIRHWRSPGDDVLSAPPTPADSD